MILRNLKLFIALFIFLAYMGIGIFGLFQFSHVSGVPMANCPYSKNSFSVCDNSLGHINNWRQFSNTIFPSLFIFSLLIFGIILYFLNKRNFLNQKQYFYKWKYYLYNKKLDTSPNRIIKWLSLLENSPAVNVSVSL